MPAPGNWLLFSEARKIVMEKGFGKQADYYSWSDRPENIPANPRSTYAADWKGWAHFLGKGEGQEGSKPKRRVGLLPFAEAKQIAQRLMAQNGITSQSQWHAWVKTPERPREIPADPAASYRGKGWISWPDWFGRDPARASGREEVRSFSEARIFARSLGLVGSKQWYEWAKSPERPSDIPLSPESRYDEDGWDGWGDFLGAHSRWTKLGITSFLNSLKPCITQLTELDLYLILSKNRMLRRDSRRRGQKLLKALTHVRTPEELEALKRQLAEEIANETTGDVSEPTVDEPSSDVENVDIQISVDELGADDNSSLRQIDILQALMTVDRVVELGISDDQEVLTFMVNERIAMLWQEAMASGEHVVFEHLRQLTGGEYASMIRDRFSEEYQKVSSLPLPEGYRSVDARNQPVSLNLMQRLTAFRLLHENRLGNWSGVGAGKTNAAVFASAVIDAKMTFILAANATVRSWKRTIGRAFDPDTIHIHDQKPMEFTFQEGKRNFLVVNYESFQLEWTEAFINLVTRQSRIDFVIFDEVQFARQRHAAESRMSIRRKHVNSLIRGAVTENPELRILAMSATPVINNLREAVKVLELIHPEIDFSGVPIGSSIANAIGVHLLIRKYGIRYVPPYGQRLVKTPVSIDGQDLLERLLGVKARDILQMEQILLEVKLRHLADWVRRGTLIYTHYINGIVEPLTKAVESLGLKVRHFTGKDRVVVEEFVRDFKENRVDVLIGSAPVGTGVDGLQFVLDRVVFITLPWSHAEYLQIVGRLLRQGSSFDSVDVIFPQVTLRQERVGQWSWDDQRLRCIEYKQTLADAALDGVIPQGNLPSREEMQRRSLEALKVWADNVFRESSAIETQPGEIIK